MKDEVTLRLNPEQTSRVFSAAGEACAMLEAILVLAGEPWAKRNKGVGAAHRKLRRALLAAGVPESGLTFSPIARRYRKK